MKIRLPFSFPSIRKPTLGLPFLSIMSLLPTPYTKLQFGGMRVAIAALAVVAVGFIATLWLTIAGTTHQIMWPTSGAEYDLPYEVGKQLAPDEHTPMTASQTLKINLGNTRLDRIQLSNLDLGKSGLAKAFSIQRATTGVTGSSAYLHIGQLTMTNSSAPSFSATNGQWGSASLAARVDGHTQEMTLDATVPHIIIDSDRGSGTYVASDSVVDRVIIEIDSNSGASIGELIISDVDASVGSFSFDYTKIGNVSIDATNSFGDGSGIDSASFTIAESISTRTVSDSLVDTPINVR
jgi:hypothetical protein